MKGMKRKSAGNLSAMAGVEEVLATSLQQAAGEVARTECFDTEQRAEVYAILDTMRADTEQHQMAVGHWVNDQSGEIANV